MQLKRKYQHMYVNWVNEWGFIIYIEFEQNLYPNAWLKQIYNYDYH